MINTVNLNFSYQHSEELVLNDIGINIKSGEFVAVLGHNGSGKSTLAKHFNCLLLPTNGAVFIKSMDTKNHTKTLEIRQTVGMVFQNPDNQLVATIVEEDIAFGPENLGIEPEEIRQRVDRALELVDMTEYKTHAPHLLSGGQKQRIAIAGILAMNPRCIVFDEPTAMLDPLGRIEVLNTIKRLNHEGITIVLITHYMEEAVLADRIIVMDKGRVTMNGTPEVVFSNVPEIKKIGLDVPQVTELLYELKLEGVDVSCDCLTLEECAEEILTVFKER